MNETIKVLLIMPRCTNSGPIRVLENIIQYSDRREFEYSLITIGEENPSRSVLSTFAAGMNYKYIPIGKAQALFGKNTELLTFINELNPDVIHTTGVIPDVMISRLFPQKQLIIAHANLKVDYQFLIGGFKGKILARIHLHAMKKAKKVIACSKSLHEIYKRDGFIVPYIRNGVNICDTTHYINKEEIRRKLKLPSDKIIFCYAASFNERKNQEFLINVFSRMQNSQDLLLLLGDGPTFTELNHKFGSIPNVRFEGRVSNINDYYKACDYFVSSSYQEGMPMGVLEAMSEGLPVLLSDIEQHREVIETNELIGCLYKVDDELDFIEQLNRIKSMDYTSLSSEARKTIMEHFDARKMSHQYQEAYRDIARS